MEYRIPRQDGAFNSYIRATTNYLQENSDANAIRLDLSPNPATEWGTRRTNWDTIFALWEDPSKRTKTITAEKNAQKKAFIQFATPILTGISVHPALNADDRGVFNLPERDAPTDRSKILDTPFGKIISMDGGIVKIRLRTTIDGNRSSKHPDADHIEMRYALVDLNAKIIDPDLPTSSDLDTGTRSNNGIPATAKDCTLSTISTKAIFTLDVGQENSGKRIYAFFRWVNATKLELSSGWSMPVQGVVV